MSEEALQERIDALRQKQAEYEEMSLDKQANAINDRISDLEDVAELEEKIRWYESHQWTSAAEDARKRLREIRGESE